MLCVCSLFNLDILLEEKTRLKVIVSNLLLPSKYYLCLSIDKLRSLFSDISTINIMGVNYYLDLG